MLSFTSNSDVVAYKSWWLIWVIAFGLSTFTLISVERYWRIQGYRPDILDSTQLWAMQRERLYTKNKIPLAILGASRIEFGLDLKLFGELLPKYQPVMLAVNGHYPLASLRDLAEDKNFKGVVLCDVDSRGMSKIYWNMQSNYSSYFHTQWTPSWRIHRQILTSWQRYAIIANPDMSITAILKRWFSGNGMPWKRYHYFHRNRTGDIDFTQTDITALTKHFEDELQKGVATQPLAPPEEWLMALDEVNNWVRKIQARGGEVIFYETPTSGTLRKIESLAYPRTKYWDRFAMTTPAKTLNYADEERLANIRLPDQSHLDLRDKADYTKTLAKILVERNLLSH